MDIVPATWRELRGRGGGAIQTGEGRGRERLQGLGLNVKSFPEVTQSSPRPRLFPPLILPLAESSLRKVSLLQFQIYLSFPFPTLNIEMVSIKKQNRKKANPNLSIRIWFFKKDSLLRMVLYLRPICKSADGHQLEFQPSRPVELTDHPR